mgnify:CR=1 FL=1
MKELTNIDFRRYKWRLPALIALLVVVAGSFWLNTAPFRSGFEITDELGGNIFPSSILSVATTDAQVIVPADSLYVGNSKSCISIRIRSGKAYSRYVLKLPRLRSFPVPYLSLCWLNHGRNIRSIPILSGITKR